MELAAASSAAKENEAKAGVLQKNFSSKLNMDRKEKNPIRAGLIILCAVGLVPIGGAAFLALRNDKPKTQVGTVQRARDTAGDVSGNGIRSRRADPAYGRAEWCSEAASIAEMRSLADESTHIRHAMMASYEAYQDLAGVIDSFAGNDSTEIAKCRAKHEPLLFDECVWGFSFVFERVAPGRGRAVYVRSLLPEDASAACVDLATCVRSVWKGREVSFPSIVEGDYFATRSGVFHVGHQAIVNAGGYRELYENLLEVHTERALAIRQELAAEEDPMARIALLHNMKMSEAAALDAELVLQHMD